MKKAVKKVMVKTDKYLAVRNLPSLNGEDFDTLIEELDAKFEICKACNGEGHSTFCTPTPQEGVQNFKFHKSPLLSELKKRGILNAEKAKQIIEILLYDRKQCSECQGSGLVKKSGKNKHAKKSK